MANFFTRLLHPHRYTSNPTSGLIQWPGDSGTEYPYTIYPIDAPFHAVPGNFIYAKQAADGRWIPIYIAQTRDLRQRLEGKIRLEEAKAHGATHIHADYCSAGQSARCTEEKDLIHRWQPVCNEVFKNGPA